MERQDKIFIRRCIELANESHLDGDLPFGAIIVQNKQIVVEAGNTVLKDITGHAEINAIKKAITAMPDLDFSRCVLYTNFEPCAMCSFIIRDVGVGRVVFSVHSPHLGGYSKWNILSDDTLSSEFTSRHRAEPPEISAGILKKNAQKVFDNLQWKMHKRI